MNRLKVALILGNKPDFNEYALKYFILSLNKNQILTSFISLILRSLKLLLERRSSKLDNYFKSNLLGTKVNFDYYIMIIQIG